MNEIFFYRSIDLIILSFDDENISKFLFQFFYKPLNKIVGKMSMTKHVFKSMQKVIQRKVYLTGESLGPRCL